MVEKTVELKNPVTVEGVKTSSLTMRSPKVKDLLASEKAAKGDSEREVYLITLLCGVPKSAIEDLEMSDYKALQEKLQSFLS
jgi:hypothetical protein